MAAYQQQNLLNKIINNQPNQQFLNQNSGLRNNRLGNTNNQNSVGNNLPAYSNQLNYAPYYDYYDMPYQGSDLQQQYYGLVNRQGLNNNVNDLTPSLTNLNSFANNGNSSPCSGSANILLWLIVLGGIGIGFNVLYSRIQEGNGRKQNRNLLENVLNNILDG